MDPARKRARSNDPATSKEAAKRAALFAATQAARLVTALKKHGPLSPKQFYAYTGLSHIQADRRRKELIAAGHIRIKRMADGSPFLHEGCEVWEAC